MKSIKQIAGELNLSIATVSYVINDKWREKRISETTARRVQERIARHNYRPNRLARQLRTKKTGIIGVLLPDLSQAYNLGILAGIERSIGTAGYMSLLCNSDRGEREAEQLAALQEHEIEGLIFCPSHRRGTPGMVRGLMERRQPLVLVDNYFPRINVDFVVSDNTWAGRALTCHLLDRGRRRIAYIGTRRNMAVLHDRFRGYKNALSAHGLRPDRNLTLMLDAKEEADPAPVLGKLLDREAPDALLVGSFIYFASGFRFLAGSGIAVPEKLAIAGFDAPPARCVQELLADRGNRFDAPPVFAEQQARVMGETAANLLLGRIRGNTGEPEQVMLKPVLHLR